MENIRNVVVTHKYNWDAATLPAELASKQVYNRPDEYMMYSCNTVPAIYTSGYEFNATECPVDFPVYPLPRNGKLSYQGPGVLTLVMLLDWHSILQSDLQRIIIEIRESIIEYVLAKHGIQLQFNEADPGLYDENNAKMVSIDCEINRPRLIYYVTVNVLADLAVFQNISICGTENRSMTNLLKTGTSITNEHMDSIATDILQYIWKNIYPDYDNVVSVQNT